MIVYAQRVREAFNDVPIVVGGIEASLRRIAHFDYWSEKVRRSILLDAKADLLVYGNGERQIVEIAHRLAKGEKHRRRSPICAAPRSRATRRREGWTEIDSTTIDEPGQVESADRSVRDGRRRRAPGTGAARGASQTRAATAPLLRRARRRAAAARRTRREVLPPRPDLGARALRHPHAAFEAVRDDAGPVRARLAHPASRIESGKRARTGAASRRCRRVAQSAAAAADDEGDGCDLRAAVSARAASVLRQGEDSGVPDDPLLDRDPARLLRRLHVLFDHRARRPHHPEPLGEFRSSRRSRPCATRCRASPA